MADPQCAALQLYTVRDLTAKDFAGTVKKVADIGYKFVELAGYGNLANAKAARKAMDDAEALGIDTVVCPFLPEERRKDAEGYQTTAKLLEAVGSQLHQHGMVL